MMPPNTHRHFRNDAKSNNVHWCTFSIASKEAKRESKYRQQQKLGLDRPAGIERLSLILLSTTLSSSE
eukprot:scaffold22712_cov65-Attheya_sp.AAC.2